MQYSLFTYQSPLSVVQVPYTEPLPPQTQRVIVVVIGSLSNATTRSVEMLNLEALRTAGASAIMTSQPPTYASTAWTTLLTGAWPELNGASILEAGTDDLRPIVFDHLFSAAHDAGLKTAMAGLQGWESLLPAATTDGSFFARGQDAIADGQVAQAAVNFIANPQFNLILIYFGQLDVAGSAYGLNTPAYAGAARQIDNYLRQIVRTVDMSRSVLIVTSDHGLTDEGRLGGSEPELTELPFVMIGQHVVPGVYSQVWQVDLAPTVATLLGARLPALTQGRPLYEMLRLDPLAQARGQLTLAKQKVALADGYVMAVNGSGLSQVNRQDLVSAEQALLSGNHAGALELAKLVAQEATAEMVAAKSARIARERISRLALVITGLLIAFVFFWGRRGTNSLLSMAAGGMSVGIYYGLYRLAGYSFSLSTIENTSVFFVTLLQYAGFGLVGGGVLVLLGLLYRDERRWSAAIRAGYDYGVWATFLAALPALIGYWQHGAIIRWYLPELGLALVHFVAVVQVVVVAALAIPLPWIIAPLVWATGHWRARSETRAQVWDPIARLRR